MRAAGGPRAEKSEERERETALAEDFIHQRRCMRAGCGAPSASCLPAHTHTHTPCGPLPSYAASSVVPRAMRDKEQHLQRSTSPAPPPNHSAASTSLASAAASNHLHVPPSPSTRKPIRLRNLLSNNETFDVLHQQVVEVGSKARNLFTILMQLWNDLNVFVEKY